MINYRKQLGALVFGQFLSLLLSFILPLFLVRLLSKDDYGLYSQFNLILSFATVFFSFGISSELYFSYPKSEIKERRILIFQSLILLIFLSIISFLLFLLPPIRHLLIANDALEDNYLYLILTIFVSIPNVIITALYVLNNDNKTSAAFLPIMAVIRVALLFLFYFNNPSVESIFQGLFMSYFLQFIFTLFYSFKLISLNDGDKLWNFSILKDQLRYAIPLGCASSIRVLTQQLDKLIILSFVTPAVYAVYAISFYGVPGLDQVYQSINQVYIPRMSLAYKNGDMALLKNLYGSMVSKTLCYTIPVILIIIVYAPIIIPSVFSDKYVDSIPYFRLYLSTFIFSAMGSGNILRAIGYTKKTMNAYLYTLIVIAPITYVLISNYKLDGAITCAVLGCLLPRFILTYYDLDAVGLSIREIFPWRNITKILFISLFVLVPIFIVNNLVEMNFILLLSCICLYLLIVFLIEIHFGVFLCSYADCMKIVRKIKK